jgi:hypothetical protein
MIRLHTLFASFVLWIGSGKAQDAGWMDGQVNATMCQWQEPRGRRHIKQLESFLTQAVGVIRDTVYIDGGYLYWEPGMNNGEYGAPTQDGRLPYKF